MFATLGRLLGFGVRDLSDKGVADGQVLAVVRTRRVESPFFRLLHRGSGSAPAPLRPEGRGRKSRRDGSVVKCDDTKPRGRRSSPDMDLFFRAGFLVG